MKVIEKIALILYSNIILILSIILCVIIFGWLDIGLVGDIIKNVVLGETSGRIVLGVCIVFILLAIKCIFFSSYSSNETIGQGVLLENENGNYIIEELNTDLQGDVEGGITLATPDSFEGGTMTFNPRRRK